MNTTMTEEPLINDTPPEESELDDYTPLLLAFGPADHAFEAEGSEDDSAFIVGYN